MRRSVFDSLPPPTAASIVDPTTGLVRGDLECRRCGYNLRTLAEAGRCPECGSPVGLSTRGNFLKFADPDWVATIARGLRIIFYIILINIIIQIASDGLRQLSPALITLANFVTTCVDLYGIWLLTEPDPSGIGEEKNVTARKVLRVAATIAAAATLAEVVQMTMLTQSRAILVLSQVFVIVAGLAGVVAWFAKFSFFANIARRIPNDLLVRRAKMLRIAIVVCYAVAIVGGAILLAIQIAGTASSSTIIGAGAMFLLPAGIGLIVFGIWTIVFIYHLQKSVTNESRLSHQNWANAGP